MTSGKQVLLSLIILSLSLLWFENTSTDICLQNLLFNSENHSWLLENPEWYVRFIFYDGIKIFLIILALSILSACLCSDRLILSASINMAYVLFLFH